MPCKSTISLVSGEVEERVRFLLVNVRAGTMLYKQAIEVTELNPVKNILLTRTLSTCLLDLLRALCEEAAMMPIRELGSQKILTIKANQVFVPHFLNFGHWFDKFSIYSLTEKIKYVIRLKYQLFVLRYCSYDL